METDTRLGRSLGCNKWVLRTARLVSFCGLVRDVYVCIGWVEGRKEGFRSLMRVF